jgi:hypothetical protein
MDVDLASIEDPEKAKLQAEGQCFVCHEKGHRAHRCPKRPNKSRQNPPNKSTRAHEVKVVDKEKEDIKGSIYKGMKQLSKEE